MKNKRNLREDIAMVAAGYGVIAKIDSGIIWFPVIAAFINSLSPFVNLFMSARIVTELAGGRNLQILVNYAIITISLNLILSIIKRFVDLRQNIYTNDFYDKFELFFNDVNNKYAVRTS
jgi:ATP-binding cassette subfamily B protein